ncbi:MAG: prepilin-type N-terminal cleavage/methylation domain-containing protein [Candidatus Eisenbacteria sp.]|nr:prepilin-type N-terminal cleavage/methylation domain-containing protein [Candidatus Eisenbacteria bacterium]
MQALRRRKNRKGFTMIELMVVVVIVGILAAIAIPIYGKYIKNARMTEATGRIGEIVTACKADAQENPNATTGLPEWHTAMASGAVDGIIDMTQSDNFKYSFTSTNPATTDALIVTATGMNKMTGASVVVTVDDINSNGSQVVTLP